MGTSIVLAQAAHVLTAIVVGVAIVATYRWMRRQSAAVATLVAATVLCRVAVGLAMFWTSYLSLPLARSLQVGGGFWEIAVDATGYYEMATLAVDAGRLYPLNHVVPAPLYVDALASWMMLVGVSPAAGMFLNVCLYLAIAALLIAVFKPSNDWRRDLPLLVGLGAYSFCPVVVLHSTQPLKDELSAFLTVLAAVGVVGVVPAISRRDGVRRLAPVALGAFAVGIATFGTAAIRWYDPLIIIGALVVTFAVFLVWKRTTAFVTYAGAVLLVLAAAWIGFWAGSGPYYEVVGTDVQRIVQWEPPHDLSVRELTRAGRAALARIVAIPSTLSNATQVARTGFVTSGGATNIAVRLHDDADAGAKRARELSEEQHLTAGYQARLARLKNEKQRREQAAAVSRAASERAEATRAGAAARTAQAGTTAAAPASAAPAPNLPPPTLDDEFRAVPVTRLDHVKAAATGLAILFAPIAVSESIAGVQIAGGRGLLSVVDLDTLYIDGSLIAVLVLVWKRRDLIRDRWPFVVFAVVLAGTTALLLGYVVTNFGTLWRLRPLAAVPLWMLGLAVAPLPRDIRDIVTPAATAVNTRR